MRRPRSTREERDARTGPQRPPYRYPRALLLTWGATVAGIAILLAAYLP